jgi:hypothetical protein
VEPGNRLLVTGRRMRGGALNRHGRASPLSTCAHDRTGRISSIAAREEVPTHCGDRSMARTSRYVDVRIGPWQDSDVYDGPSPPRLGSKIRVARLDAGLTIEQLSARLLKTLLWSRSRRPDGVQEDGSVDRRGAWPARRRSSPLEAGSAVDPIRRMAHAGRGAARNGTRHRRIRPQPALLRSPL